MKTIEDIEKYLIDLNMPYEEIGEGIWKLNNVDEHVNNIIIMHAPPITIFRVKLMDLPKNNREKLFEQLLKYNANDMVSGAYGIEVDEKTGKEIVVAVDTLQSENLDYNEFLAAIDSLSMVILDHFDVLKSFRD